MIMANEIEHKYLVINDDFKEMAVRCEEIVQGYIDRTPQHVVRVRKKGAVCFITIKGKNDGDRRLEFEYEIPTQDFIELLMLCSGRILRKCRWIVPYNGHIWEVDEYQGELAGMVIAEIELSDSEEEYSLPPFVGENVTGDKRYYNSNL